MLNEANDPQAVHFPFTQITDALMHPALILPDDPATPDHDGRTSQAVFVVGAQVRAVDQFSIGKAGTLSGGPRRSQSGNELAIDIDDIYLTGGKWRPVPIANVDGVAWVQTSFRANPMHPLEHSKDVDFPVDARTPLHHTHLDHHFPSRRHGRLRIAETEEVPWCEAC